MSEPEHPLKDLWPAVLQDLEQLPVTVILPKAEMLRFFRLMYFLGINHAMLGMTTLEMQTMGDSMELRNELRAAYYVSTADWTQANRDGSFLHMLATVRAHEITELDLLRAISEVHSGDAKEGKKIAQAVIACISGKSSAESPQQ